MENVSSGVVILLFYIYEGEECTTIQSTLLTGEGGFVKEEENLVLSNVLIKVELPPTFRALALCLTDEGLRLRLRLETSAFQIA